jgi:hypothetical protein
MGTPVKIDAFYGWAEHNLWAGFDVVSLIKER